MSTLAEYEAGQDAAEQRAHAAELLLAPTPAEVAALVDMADRMVARRDQNEAYWRAVRRAAVTGAPMPAPPVDEGWF